MNKKSILISIFLVVVSVTFIVGRSFRVSKVPHGSEASCNTCHTAGGGSPLNPFGLDVNSRVSVAGNETFWGPELAALDSDGDGFTNGEELQDPNGTWVEGTANPGDVSLVTNPGNPDQFPTSIEEFEDGITYYKLFNNYPNPFNPTTQIKFSIPNNEYVSLKIFDVSGREVESLVNEQLRAGIHTYRWNAGSNSSGTYFSVLNTGNYSEVKKMLLMK